VLGGGGGDRNVVAWPFGGWTQSGLVTC
jgi:hypothetical protein